MTGDGLACGDEEQRDEEQRDEGTTCAADRSAIGNLGQRQETTDLQTSGKGSTFSPKRMNAVTDAAESGPEVATMARPTCVPPFQQPRFAEPSAGLS
jgi:hypothetical protein